MGSKKVITTIWISLLVSKLITWWSWNYKFTFFTFLNNFVIVTLIFQVKDCQTCHNYLKLLYPSGIPFSLIYLVTSSLLPVCHSCLILIMFQHFENHMLCSLWTPASPTLLAYFISATGAAFCGQDGVFFTSEVNKPSSDSKSSEMKCHCSMSLPGNLCLKLVAFPHYL